MGLLNALVRYLLHIDINAICEENESLKNSLCQEQHISKKKDSRLSQMETENKSLRREVANLKSRRTLLEGEVSSLRYKLGEIHEDIEPEEKDDKISIIQLDLWRIKLEEKTKEVEELRKELESAHKEYSLLANRLKALQRKYDSVKSDLDNIQQSQSEQLASLQSECRRLAGRLAVVNSERERLREQISFLLEKKSNRRQILKPKHNIQPPVYESEVSASANESGDTDNYANSIAGTSLNICDILQSIILYRNKHTSDIVDSLEECAMDNANNSYNVADILASLIRHRNKTLTNIISALQECENVVISDIADIEQPSSDGTYSIFSKNGKYGLLNGEGKKVLDVIYDKIEILPNNSVLYSDGEDWYLLGIDDSLAIYNDNDEFQINMLSEKYRIYNLTIKKNLYIGQKPIEFYLFDDKIFKFDKSSKVWTLWYSNDEILLSTSDDFQVTDDNQLKLLKDNLVLYIAPDGTISEETYIEEPAYVERIPLKNGYFIVKLVDGYWGIVDDEENYAVLAQYNMISPINVKYLRFQTGNLWGVMTIEGDILIDAKYHSIESYSNGEFVVTKENPLNSEEIITEKISQ